MFDFAQTMKDWHRMCKVMTDKDPHDACSSCPLGDYGCSAVYENIDTYKEIDFEVIGEKITVWAAEHPVRPVVYPMWVEWLAEQRLVNIKRLPIDDYGGIITQIEPSGEMYAHIPADIAQKLGIEPKEVDCGT